MDFDNKTAASIYINSKEVQTIVIDGKTAYQKSSSQTDYFYVENLYVGSNTLTLTTTENGSPSSSGHATSVQYSTDQSTWTTITFDTSNPYTISMDEGDKVYFRNNSGMFNYYDGTNYYYTQFNCSENFGVGGNLKSLIDYTNINTVNLEMGCYSYMFREASTLVSFDTTLPDTILADYCYLNMFRGTGLTSSPALPATELSYGCYWGMFINCTSFVNAPVLPATILTGHCYESMFNGCTSLVNAPELPATTLAEGCYQGMFRRCAMTTAPELPATTLVTSCYNQMFRDCSNLNSITSYANDISARNCLTNWVSGVAGSGTFYNCGTASYSTGNSGIPSGWSSGANYFYIENLYEGSNTLTLTTTSLGSPTIGYATSVEYSTDKSTWTTITFDPTTPYDISMSQGDKVYFRNDSGYFNAFVGVSNRWSTMFDCSEDFTYGGDLKTLLNYQSNSVSLQRGCFSYLFYNSSTLVKTPSILPATILAYDSYRSMFGYCTSLTTAPNLPATILSSGCYANMFYSCTSLTTAPVLPATTLVESCYYSMFKGCSSLNKVSTYANDISASFCLDDWLDNVSATGDFYNYGHANYPSGVSGIPTGWTEVKPDYFYVENTYAGTNTLTLTTTTAGSPSSSGYSTTVEYSKDKSTWTTVTFNTSTPYNITMNQGEKVYLRNNNGVFNYTDSAASNYYVTTITCSETHNIGGNITSIIDDTNNNVNIPTGCFYRLFINNNALEAANITFNDNIGESSYREMFKGCTSLTTPPAILPATTLANSCYRAMFDGCTSMTTIPQLPASTVVSYSYAFMFQNCGIDSATLTATSINNYGCQRMFKDCSSLNKVTTYIFTLSGGSSLNNWLSGVSATGDFYNFGGATFSSGASGIPTGWTEHTSL